MKLLLLAGTAALAFVSAASQAEARGRGHHHDELRLIAETTIPGEDGALSLCHLVTQYTGLGMPFWVTSKGYALAGARCGATEYIPLDASDLAALSEEGLLPPGLPDTPELGLADRAKGAWAGALGLGIIGAIVVGDVRRRRNGTPEVRDETRILKILAKAAKTAGKPGRAEVALICDYMASIGCRASADQVNALAVGSRAGLKPADAAKFAAKMHPHSQAAAYRGAELLLNRGGLDAAGEAFLAEMRRAFAFEAESGPTGAAAPA